MGVINRLAWKNIWRNPIRTSITVTAMGLGLSLLLLSVSLGEGMTTLLQERLTGVWMGDVQIHRENYRQDDDLEKDMSSPQEILSQASALGNVQGGTYRLIVPGLLSIAGRSSPVEVFGTNIELETQVTDALSRIEEGALPSAPSEILIGKELASNLDIELGTRLVLTVGNQQTNEMSYQLVTVSGILKTSQPLLDSRAVIMPYSELGSLTGRENTAHQISVRLHPNQDPKMVSEQIREALNDPSLEVLPWNEIEPSFASMQSLQRNSVYILVFITFFIVSLGTLNTLTISFLERTRELGTLRAIGTFPGQIAKLLVLETFLLSCIGSLVGVVFFLGFFTLLAIYGLDLGGEVEFSGVVFSEKLYPALALWPTLIVILLTMGMTFVTGLVVARRALKLEPLEAMRK